MPLPVTVYRWDDDQAPQILSGNTSEVLNVLKKCLVEGYGDKQPLGWTVAFEETGAAPKIAFRNDTTKGGSGSYGIFKGRNATDDDQGVECQAAMSMTSFDDLLLAGNKQGFRVIKKNNQYDTDKWILIGTAVGFYFFGDYLDKYSNAIIKPLAGLYCGDLKTSLNGDVGRFICVSHFISKTPLYPTGTDGTKWHGSINYLQDATSSELSGIELLLPQTDGVKLIKYSVINRAKEVFSTDPLSKTTILHSLPVVAKDNEVDSDNTESKQSLKAPWFRGEFPGLFLSEFVFDKELLWPATINMIGGSYFLLRNPDKNNGSLMLIKLGEWDV
ncbi:hypothetical protein D5018_03980 [Parashewanella curva]|uniref:Uncharacterized protein n=1 Tax=Parashewanella curva TaxID=2338552 RepID=A0A3L8Q2A7_9GAMM|nr:hypothetical protein [Parashewanella curva]RLV61008.1 hypothetical protein D5018_03980 [Parashewanella curva]